MHAPRGAYRVPSVPERGIEKPGVTCVAHTTSLKDLKLASICDFLRPLLDDCCRKLWSLDASFFE